MGNPCSIFLHYGLGRTKLNLVKSWGGGWFLAVTDKKTTFFERKILKKGKEKKT